MRELGVIRAASLPCATVLLVALAACGEDGPPGAAPDPSPGDRAAAASSDRTTAATPVEHARAADLARAAEQARAAIEAYVAAVNAMDLDSAGVFLADSPDFRWVEDGTIRYGSAHDARAALAALVDMASSTELTVSDLSVAALSPDVAVATCRFVQTVAVEGGPGFAFAGAMTIVLRREGGRWLFVSGHTSSARPRTEGAAIGEPGGRP